MNLAYITQSCLSGLRLDASRAADVLHVESPNASQCKSWYLRTHGYGILVSLSIRPNLSSCQNRL